MTLLTAGVLLAVLTAVCAFDFSSLPYFDGPSKAQAAEVASSDEDATNAADAERLLEDARRRMLAYSSIEARIEYATKSPPAAGDGRYWERGALKRRFELKMRGMENATLLQINDGKMLWTRCTTPRDAMTAEQPNATPPHSPQLHLAELGLLGLLTQVQQDYDVNLAGSGQLAGESVFVLKGVLSQETLTRLSPKRGEEIRSGAFSAWSELPGDIPASIVLALGSEDAVPRRIQFRAIDEGVRLADWPQAESQETLTIDLRELQINRSILAEVFTHP
ncbi:hypothetical protein [Blastopirellula retiformator]|uniref:hypothetical protein n=1 Tax=Blastopirellula retiformator TaxID=2527970 RepID=UPI0011B6E653|nr:hypothetical protein [Blastopirellula retiformator]